MHDEEKALLEELAVRLAAQTIAPEGGRAEPAGARLLLEIRGRRGERGPISVGAEHRIALDLREARFDPEALDLAETDLKILGGVLARDRDGVLGLLRYVRAGDGAAALAKAKELGLTEREFRAQGGGIFGLILLAVAIVLVAATPTSSEADPIPLPSHPHSVDDQTAEDMDGYYHADGH